MGLREFTSVPADPRDWGRWMRAQFITADSVAPDTITTGMIVDANVTFAKIQDLAGLSVFGRAVNSIGVGGNISAANDFEVLRRQGASVGFGKITTGGIADDAVSNALLANMAAATIKGSVAGGDPADLTAAQVISILSSLLPTSGTYTPTLTNTTNLDASTAFPARWIRVGNEVFVSGTVQVDATALAQSELGISLPIASNFAASTDCSGAAGGSSVQQSAAIVGDATNDRARMQWLASTTAAQNMSFTFGYTVI